MNHTKLVLIPLFVLVISGCGKKKVAPADYETTEKNTQSQDVDAKGVVSGNGKGPMDINDVIRQTEDSNLNSGFSEEDIVLADEEDEIIDTEDLDDPDGPDDTDDTEDPVLEVPDPVAPTTTNNQGGGGGGSGSSNSSSLNLADNKDPVFSELMVVSDFSLKNFPPKKGQGVKLQVAPDGEYYNVTDYVIYNKGKDAVKNKVTGPVGFSKSTVCVPGGSSCEDSIILELVVPTNIHSSENRDRTYNVWVSSELIDNNRKKSLKSANERQAILAKIPFPFPTDPKLGIRAMIKHIASQYPVNIVVLGWQEEFIPSESAMYYSYSNMTSKLSPKGDKGSKDEKSKDAVKEESEEKPNNTTTKEKEEP